MARLLARLVALSDGWAQPFGDFNHRWLSALFRPMPAGPGPAQRPLAGPPAPRRRSPTSRSALLLGVVVLDVLGQPAAADIALVGDGPVHARGRRHRRRGLLRHGRHRPDPGHAPRDADGRGARAAPGLARAAGGRARRPDDPGRPRHRRVRDRVGRRVRRRRRRLRARQHGQPARVPRRRDEVDPPGPRGRDGSRRRCPRPRRRRSRPGSTTSSSSGSAIPSTRCTRSAPTRAGRSTRARSSTAASSARGTRVGSGWPTGTSSAAPRSTTSRRTRSVPPRVAATRSVGRPLAPAAGGLERGERPDPRLGVVDDRRRVVDADPAAGGGLVGRRSCPTGRGCARRDAGELRDPAPDVGAVRVEATALRHRVEDAEVRLRVRPGRGRPLPAAVVRGDVAVDQVAHEVRLARAPVDQQVLRQERRDDHPRPVGHPARGEELAHRRIDERVARPAAPPRLDADRVRPTTRRRRTPAGTRAGGPRADGRGRARRTRARSSSSTKARRPSPAPTARSTTSSGDSEPEMEVRRQPGGPVDQIRAVARSRRTPRCRWRASDRAGHAPPARRGSAAIPGSAVGADPSPRASSDGTIPGATPCAGRAVGAGTIARRGRASHARRNGE